MKKDGIEKMRRTLVLLTICFAIWCNVDAFADIPAAERAALIDLYNSTNGDSWNIKTGWKDAPLHTDGFSMPGTEENWHGIDLDGGAGHVASINIGNNMLTGSIPASIGNFSSLSKLYLAENNLTGSIPSQIGNLTSLEYLTLFDNQLSGNFPSIICNLTSIKSVHLWKNRLSGSLPSQIGNLTSVTTFRVGYNAMNGEIPSSIKNMTAATTLDLQYNMFYTSDPTVREFLNGKDADWEPRQTVPPTNVAASPLSSNSVRISWTPILYTAHGGYYIVRYGTSSGGYTKSDCTADKSASSLDILGLNPGTKYYFTIRTYTPAHDHQQNNLTSANSEEVNVTTAAAAPTVTTTTATSVTGVSAMLNGTVNPNGASTAVIFEYGLTTSYGSTKAATPSPVTGTAATSVAAALTDLLPNTTYHFRVKATNSVDTRLGIDQTFTTKAIAPAASTSPATTVELTSAILNGMVNPNNSATTVEFEYGLTIFYGATNTASQSPLSGSGEQPVSVQITNLLPDTTYHFRVKATNSAGSTTGLDQSFITSALPGLPVAERNALITFYNSTGGDQWLSNSG